MSRRYRYRAATSGGRILEGVVDADSRAGALAELRSRRLFPVFLELSRDVAGRRVRFRSRRAAVGTWTREVAALLAGGIPLDRALAITEEHAGHDGLAEALSEVRRAVQGGSGLAEALERHPRYFPAVAAAMVAAGEASGALDTVFEQLAEHLEEAGDLRSQVRSALLYPALMAVVATVGVTVLLLFVVPRFSEMLEEVGTTLPLSTRLLMATGDVVAGWWWLFLLIAAALAVWVRRSARSPEALRRWHEARLGLPWAGDLEHKFGTARFTRALAVLLHSGVAVVPALRIARTTVANTALGERLDRAIDAVAEGTSVSAGLAGALVPMAVHMLATGEESGRLDEMCQRVADTYDGEVRRALRTLIAMMEPAMILVFGAIVGLVALAMLQAIYSINTSAL